jgi:hypothetical protein
MKLFAIDNDFEANPGLSFDDQAAGTRVIKLDQVGLKQALRANTFVFHMIIVTKGFGHINKKKPPTFCPDLTHIGGIMLFLSKKFVDVLLHRGGNPDDFVECKVVVSTGLATYFFYSPDLAETIDYGRSNFADAFHGLFMRPTKVALTRPPQSSECFRIYRPHNVLLLPTIFTSYELGLALKQVNLSGLLIREIEAEVVS